MAVNYIGKSRGIFGVANPLPLNGLPDGRVRLRIRPNDFVKAFVKTTDSIRGFYMTEKDGQWEPLCEIGRNQTI